MDEVILSRIRKEAYEQGYQDGKVDGYNQAGKHLSTIEPRRWIPVTERLPEYENAVLVYEPTYKNIFEACCIDGRWESFDTGNPRWLDETIYGNIVAWMPLPPPYEYPPKDFMNPPEGEQK